MASKITPEDIKRMNQLYYELHTYAAVARIVGCSAGTVSKYVDKNWRPVDESTIKRVHLEDIPEPNFERFRKTDNFGSLCLLSEEERKEMENLWKELEG